ncbi:sugar-binding domain-containing protein [Streptosporangium sp. NPDC002524]|uniref:sugar-binding transcriptional regulator n=1 Tax=Streptosporangium sp. NPDC002524 TaxID=3154537 RepID=UPI00331DB5A5
MVVPEPGRGQGSGHLRLLARVARMYHEQGMRQPEIAAALGISQPRVSRLLKEAIARGVVRTVVALPEGVHTELEERLQRRYALRDAVVVDTGGTTGDVALASAAAFYFGTTFRCGDVIGVSSRSGILPAAVDRMHSRNTQAADRVVQVVGDLGGPGARGHAARLISRLAGVTRARPVFAPSAGVAGTPTARDALLRDPAVAEVTAQWRELTVVLVDIGSLEPPLLPPPLPPGSGDTGRERPPGSDSPLGHADRELAPGSGHAVGPADRERPPGTGSPLGHAVDPAGRDLPPGTGSPLGHDVDPADREELRSLGAVGDVCLRFFDAGGDPVDSAFDRRVVGIGADTLRSVGRRVAVAGGEREHAAIRAALRGGWVNVLITDVEVARHLLTGPR